MFPNRPLTHSFNRIFRIFGACLVFVWIIFLIHSRNSTRIQQPIQNLELSRAVPSSSSVSSMFDVAIVILVTAQPNDISDLKRCIRSIQLALPRSQAPILIFHEGDFSSIIINDLQKFKSQTSFLGIMKFFQIELKLPIGCCQFEPNWSKRTKFGYHNMIRFWIKDVWLHPEIRKFRNVMRLDSDSWIDQIQPETDNLPSIPDTIMYRSNRIDNDGMPFIDQIVTFVQSIRFQPKNPSMLKSFFDFYKSQGRVPILFNNFFVSKVKLFMTSQVRKFVDSICCTPPFYLYRYRWGDAIVHYLIVAFFVEPSEFEIKPPVGYHHGG